ncbi:MAG: flavodoxin family protein [Spirochaetota bacterium]
MNSKKVLIMVGSPRKNGNSSTLADRTARGIVASGGEYEMYHLHEMDIRVCTACDVCHEDADTYCTIEDDMKPLYPKIRDAHALVIASPIYWFSVSAQTKVFMDRWYAFGSPEGYVLKGKKFGILLCYADADPFVSGAVNALRMFQDAVHYIEGTITGAVYGSAEQAGEIQSNKGVLDSAFQLGRQLVER